MVVGYVGRSALLVTPIQTNIQQMTIITKSIVFKWKLSFNENYQWTNENELFNIKTMRKINKTVNGYSVGYWIEHKFYTIKNLRKYLIKIENEDCPF